MRIAPAVVGTEADFLEQLRDAAAPLAAVHSAVDDQRLGDDRADGHARVQRRVRVLKDDLHVPPHPPHVAGVKLQDVGAFELDASRGRVDEPEDAAPDGGLARARLAHEA